VVLIDRDFIGKVLKVSPEFLKRQLVIPCLHCFGSLILRIVSMQNWLLKPKNGEAGRRDDCDCFFWIQFYISSNIKQLCACPGAITCSITALEKMYTLGRASVFILMH
jgi:hypothetical protein